MNKKNARRLGTLALVLIGSTSVCSCGPKTPPEAPVTDPPVSSSAQSAARVAPNTVEYATLPPEQRQAPPPASPSPEWSFPAITDERLPNGLGVKLVQRNTLPLVQLTLMVRSGQASDGAKPGLAVLSGEMLKVGGSGTYVGRQLLDRVESLGSSLDVLTSRDSTTLSMAVTSDRFEEALELLSLVALKPQFNDAEFRRLQRREMDRVNSQARTSAGWVANMVLYRELFNVAGGRHPYATYDATADQIEKVGLWEIKAWHQRHFSPKNATLIIAGDVPPEAAKGAAEKTFGAWRGGPVAPSKYATPSLPDGLRIFLVDRPKSSQAEVELALFGPEYQDDDYPTLKVANQVLGGGVAGRLFRDVREQRSLAYSTNSSVERVAQGPMPIVLRAGTQTAKAGLTLQALLEHAQGMNTNPPSPEETAISSRYLSDTFLLRMESVGSLGSMVTNLAIYELPNDYYDKYRQAVSSTTHSAAVTVARKYFDTTHLLAVVAGDAERLALPLSHFAPVFVVDPEKDFATTKEVAQDPNAPVELDRLDGT